MESKNILNLAKNKAIYIILTGLFIGAFSFLILIITQRNFKASTELLVVQNQQGFSDYYALSKSADYLSGIIIESIYSEKFLDEMSQNGVNLNEFLPSDKVGRLNEWSKTVKASKDPNVGMIHIKVYNNSQKQAIKISEAALDVLINKNNLFLGKGQTIEVKILSGPIWEKNPSVENLLMVVAGGFFVGAFLSLIWFYYKNEENDSEKYLEYLRNRMSQEDNYYQN